MVSWFHTKEANGSYQLYFNIMYQLYLKEKNISLMGPMYYGKEWTPLVTELTYSDTLKVTPLTLGDT